MSWCCTQSSLSSSCDYADNGNWRYTFTIKSISKGDRQNTQRSTEQYIQAGDGRLGPRQTNVGRDSCSNTIENIITKFKKRGVHVWVQHFSMVRGPIRLLPRTIYRTWPGCFPAFRILALWGARLYGVRRKRGEHGVHLTFFGQAAAARQAILLRKSGQRLFLKQPLLASTALAPIFDQRRPVPLNRLPTICLQALSTTLDLRPAVRASGRGRSAFGPCWFRRCGCRPQPLQADGAASGRR